MTLSLSILKELDQNGGELAGTTNLVKQIPGDPSGIIRSLHRCQHSGLIRSLLSHGGRGHKSIHRLTKKGRYVLTQKGQEYVRSK